MGKEKFGYTLNIRTESSGGQELRAVYEIQVGRLENVGGNDVEQLWFSPDATLTYNAYGRPYMPDRFGDMQTINPLVLPVHFFEGGMPTVAKMQQLEGLVFGAAGEPQVEFWRLSRYSELVTMNFLCKVFEYGDSKSAVARFNKMSVQDQNAFYTYDGMTKFLLDLHTCGARVVKKLDTGEWRVMTDTHQFADWRVKMYHTDTKNLSIEARRKFDDAKLEAARQDA